MSPPSAAKESIIYPACYAQKKFTWGMNTSISSGSKKLTCFPAVSAGKEEDVHTGGHGGESGNDGGNGGGNKGGDNDNSGESKHDMGHGEDKTPMSISQKLTLGYAILVGAGGLIGYLKSGSHMSLIAGSLSASLLYYVYTLLPTKPVLASALGFGLSFALLGVMGSRFKNSGKIFPAGIVSLVSVIMTGGYLHGFMRGAH